MCDPIWQVTFRSSEMGIPMKSYIGHQLYLYLLQPAFSTTLSLPDHTHKQSVQVRCRIYYDIVLYYVCHISCLKTGPALRKNHSYECRSYRHMITYSDINVNIMLLEYMHRPTRLYYRCNPQTGTRTCTRVNMNAFWQRVCCCCFLVMKSRWQSRWQPMPKTVPCDKINIWYWQTAPR